MSDEDSNEPMVVERGWEMIKMGDIIFDGSEALGRSSVGR